MGGAARMPCVGGSVLAALALLAPAPAQYLNRATWLGPDDEGIRRDFHQGIEYYLDRFSYVVVPPWRDRGLLRFEDGADLRFGSVTSDAFTVEGRFDQTLELGDGWGFGYHVLQAENRDTRFLRNAFEFEWPLGERSALFAQGELFAEKDQIDVSAGAWLLREGDDALRVMLTAVDAPSRKSGRIDYVRDAWAVMVAGAFGDRDGHRVAFEVGGQLPFEVRETLAGYTFEMQRWIGSAETHLRLGARDWLVGAAELEWTDKAIAPDAGGAVAAEDFRRDFAQLRLEWWRDGTLPWSVGVLHTHLDEDGIVAGDPAADLRVDRDEWFAVARLWIPVGDRVGFEPQVFAGHVRQSFRDAVTDRSAHDFEGRIAWNTRIEFSPRAALTFLVMAELDEFGFGGGGAQFVARF